ncbi:MAG: M56 family metallopeptidase [Thermoanaerobaculales bacterium]|nr:M56 family metallopeptidase [Thermoanaerobaculales bacterium]
MNLHDTATAVLSYALQSGLLLAVGLLLPRVIRLRHPRTLLIYWRLLLIVVLLLPLAPLDWARQAQLPYMTLEGLQVEAAVATALPATIEGLSWQIVLLIATGVAVLGILRLVLGLGYLNRCRRQAQPLAPTPEPVSKVQEQLGLEVPFLVSDRLTAPLTYGWLRPAVLLPGSFCGLTADQQEGVACHELLHVRRRDWPVTFLEELLRAVVWFHPAVWLVLPRIALSREQVVDADTVRLTGKRRQYLDALWRVVCASQHSVAAMAVPFLGKRDLVDRVAWLKKENPMSKARIVLSVLVLSISLAAAGTFGASAFSNDSEPTFSTAPPSAIEKSEGEKPEGSDSKLKTTSAEALCDEITHPVIVAKVDPKYPPSAREEKVMGMVTVETVITEEGVVEDIQVIKSPDDRLSAAAVEAIQQWQFEPALCDGTPVSVYYNLTVNFRLQ